MQHSRQNLTTATNQRSPANVADKSSILVPIKFPPYYFQSQELTEKPRVFRDIPADMVIVLPDVPTQPVIARLYINEHGDIDKVELENSELGEEAQRFVTNAFAKIKFVPGRIDGAQVKSQLKIEFMIQSAIHFNAPIVQHRRRH